MHTNSDRFMTTDQCAEYIKVKPRTLDQWAWQRKGPPFKRAGRRRLYERQAVDAWLAQGEVTVP